MSKSKVIYLVLDRETVKEFLKTVGNNVYKDISKAQEDLKIAKDEGQRWLFGLKKRGFSIKDKIDQCTFHLYKLEGIE